VYSPASEDGGSRSEGSSDSKSSLETAGPDVSNVQHPHHSHSHHAHHHEAHHVFAHGLGPALAALRKKRKKFSASRSSTPVSSINANPADSAAMHSVATVLASRVSKKQLQRASSVPTRGPELIPQSLLMSRRHEITQSQQPSFDVIEIASISEQGERALLNVNEVPVRENVRDASVYVAAFVHL